MDGEWGSSTHYDYGFRIYNPSIGKFLSVDPLTAEYAFLTPYQYASNTPIQAIDLDGLEKFHFTLIDLGGEPYLKFTHQEDIVDVIPTTTRTPTQWMDTGDPVLKEYLNIRTEIIVHKPGGGIVFSSESGQNLETRSVDNPDAYINIDDFLANVGVVPKGKTKAVLGKLSKLASKWELTDMEDVLEAMKLMERFGIGGAKAAKKANKLKNEVVDTVNKATEPKEFKVKNDTILQCKQCTNTFKRNNGILEPIQDDSSKPHKEIPTHFE